MKVLRTLLNAEQIQNLIECAADEIIKRYNEPSKLLIMGLASRGIPLAERLALQLEKLYGIPVATATLDTTLYRDDFHFRKKLAHPIQSVSNICRSIDGQNVVLVDDVLYTGRSIRAALDALTDMGRASSVRLFVLVDRGCRELPIAPDYVGITLPTTKGQEVRVSLEPIDDHNHVELVEREG